MKHSLIILFTLTSLLASCTGSLWGTYTTSTPEMPPIFVTLPVTPTTLPPTATPTPVPTSAPTLTPPPVSQTSDPPVLYYTQGGDSLPVVAAHFGVDVSEIIAPAGTSPTGLLDPGTLLVIPNRLKETTPSEQIMPDSEVVFSPSAIGFNTQGYVSGANGFLSTYKEYLASTGWTTGAQAIDRIALENSINPRLLLALIEYESHWVLSRPTNLAQSDYPLGYPNYYYKGLFRQLMWAVQELSAGYYGWRSGTLTELTFPDGTKMRLSPQLNAGSAAIQYFFSRRRNPTEWAQAIDPRIGFPALYTQMFDDPWARAQTVEPLFPSGLTQPPLVLPFVPGQLWSFSGGPHAAWEREGALAALDFAPAAETNGCIKSDHWIVASAPGLVVRSDMGVVVLDLDGDSYEQTGWSLLYLHVGTEGRVPLGAWLETDGRIGHPSCEGGTATGTNLHFARKYHGEWVLADGPVPFNLSGWIAHNGEKPYDGTLTKGDQTVIACPCGSFETRIIRSPNE